MKEIKSRVSGCEELDWQTLKEYEFNNLNDKQEPYLAPIAIHPGETLTEELEYLNISQSELAARTGLTKKHISNIINGKSSITPDSALKFEKAIGLNARGMLNLQAAYEETLTRLERKEYLQNEN